MDFAQLVAEYGPVLLFVFLLLDSLGVPLPTEATLLASGYLVALGKLPPVVAMAAILAGASIGCAVSYRLGSAAGLGWLLKLGKRFGLTEAKLQAAQAWLLGHGPYAAFFSRFVPFMRCLAGYPAGMVGMPFGRYFALSILGYAAWSGLSMTGGYLLGENWETVEVYWKEIGAGALVALAAYLGVRRFRRQGRSRQG